MMQTGQGWYTLNAPPKHAVHAADLCVGSHGAAGHWPPAAGHGAAAGATGPAAEHGAVHAAGPGHLCTALAIPHSSNAHSEEDTPIERLSIFNSFWETMFFLFRGSAMQAQMPVPSSSACAYTEDEVWNLTLTASSHAVAC
ncbi:hypothetical protein HaLaN_06386 [Haematococcus lacustris]|uniref:Uncharacterized protein n=1 Tax=Haematococcus lacustris TaxID=44745 RepID=A0A699Z676_HAELA|nr:hypothetical protein HaLaN_06386 [Haematococcus lacustris]